MANAPSLFVTSPSAQTAPQENYIQPTLNHALRIWWACYWPATLIASTLAFAFAAFIRAMFDKHPAFPASIARPLLQFSPYFFTFVVTFFIFRYVLGKRFRQFRIALLPINNLQSVEELPVTWSRTFPVWWAFTWRSFLYTAVSFVVVTMPLGIYVGMFRPSPLVTIFIMGGIGLLVGAGISLFIIYSSILDESFGDFRVCLRPKHFQPPAAHPASDPVPFS